MPDPRVLVRGKRATELAVFGVEVQARADSGALDGEARNFAEALLSELSADPETIHRLVEVATYYARIGLAVADVESASGWVRTGRVDICVQGFFTWTLSGALPREWGVGAATLALFAAEGAHYYRRRGDEGLLELQAMLRTGALLSFATDDPPA